MQHKRLLIIQTARKATQPLRTTKIVYGTKLTWKPSNVITVIVTSRFVQKHQIEDYKLTKKLGLCFSSTAI